MIDLDAIKARAEAATPGPWEYAEAGTFKRGSFSLDEYFVRRPEDDVSIAADIIDPDTCEPSEALAAFIAHAREDVPALVAEVERLQADNERLGAGWFKYATITNGEVHPSGAALLRELEEAQAEIQTLEAELDALRSELGMSK